MDRKLPDTPWHIGYAKKDEFDPRRHKARCIYYRIDKTCRCGKSPCYMFDCGGSSHCKFYKEMEKTNTGGDEKTKYNSRRFESVEGDLHKGTYRNEQEKSSEIKVDENVKTCTVSVKKKKKQSVKKLVVIKNGNNCPRCGMPNTQIKKIAIMDNAGCSHIIQVLKCECGNMYLTKGLKNKLPLTIKREIVNGVLSITKSGLKITNYNPADPPSVKMVVCPKCNSRCTSLFENKGMCWKCFKKEFGV